MTGVPGTVFPATSMPDRKWWTALWPNPDAVLSALGVRPSMTVLDLCCGDGLFTAALARLTDGAVHALDLDPAMLEQARAEVERQGVAVRQWICADALQVAQHLPERVDYVFMGNTFHGVPDQRRLSAVIHDILKPQGIFAIVNWHAINRKETVVLGKPRGPKTELRMPPEAVSAVVEPAGFETLSVIELPPYHYGLLLRRK